MAKIPKKHSPHWDSEFFEKRISKEKCIFFLLWIGKQRLQILKLAVKIKEEGLPKTGPRPMAFAKQILALANVLPKFRLKDFAKESGISYGVIRVWNQEQRVIEKACEYDFQFAEAYIEELAKDYFSPKMNFLEYDLKTFREAESRVDWLLWEFKNYGSLMQGLITDEITEKTESEPNEDKKYGWNCLAYRLLRATEDRDIYNPPKDKKWKDLFEQNVEREGEFALKLIESLFFNLKEMIKKGDTKSALRFVDWFEESTLNMNKNITTLKLSVINKGKKPKIKKESEDESKEREKAAQIV